jgi:hypothetical protein
MGGHFLFSFLRGIGGRQTPFSTCTMWSFERDQLVLFSKHVEIDVRCYFLLGGLSIRASRNLYNMHEHEALRIMYSHPLWTTMLMLCNHRGRWSVLPLNYFMFATFATYMTSKGECTTLHLCTCTVSLYKHPNFRRQLFGQRKDSNNFDICTNVTTNVNLYC